VLTGIRRLVPTACERHVAKVLRVDRERARCTTAQHPCRNCHRGDEIPAVTVKGAEPSATSEVAMLNSTDPGRRAASGPRRHRCRQLQLIVERGLRFIVVRITTGVAAAVFHFVTKLFASTRTQSGGHVVARPALYPNEPVVATRRTLHSRTMLPRL